MATVQTVSRNAGTMPGSEGWAGPGQRDMWYFLLFDSFVFCCYLISYVIFRARNSTEFLASQTHMSQGFGVLNTTILLTSSWLLARCVRYTRNDQLARARRYLIWTAIFGVTFMVSKSIEWSMAANSGFGPTSTLFFSFYFFITGFHMVHMVVGLVALAYIYHNLNDPKDHVMYSVETGATLWHMVDVIWVYIFALLYLMR